MSHVCSGASEGYTPLKRGSTVSTLHSDPCWVSAVKGIWGGPLAQVRHPSGRSQPSFSTGWPFCAEVVTGPRLCG